MTRTVRSGHSIGYFISVIFFFVVASANTYAISQASQLRTVTLYPNNNFAAQQRLVNHYYSQKKYKESVQQIDEILKYKPNDIELLTKKAGIYADMELYTQAITILDYVIKLDPQNTKALKLREKLLGLQALQPKNQMGIDVNEARVNGNLNAWWQYASVHYYRFTDKGSFGGRINYANRYGTTGEQYQLEAYPKLFNLGSLSLSYAYANSTQILFPTLQYTIEPYFKLPANFEASIGVRNLRSVGVNIYDTTGSLGLYLGNNYIWLREFHFTPHASDLLEAGWTKYFDRKYTLITLKGSMGRAPDIADLAPLNQIIVLNMYGVGISGQTSLGESLIGKIATGYIHQRFPAGSTRDFFDATVGIYWQF